MESDIKGESKVVGEATDRAILQLADRLGNVRELWREWKKVYELPFNSKNKFMVSRISIGSRIFFFTMRR